MVTSDDTKATDDLTASRTPSCEALRSMDDTAANIAVATTPPTSDDNNVDMLAADTDETWKLIPTTITNKATSPISSYSSTETLGRDPSDFAHLPQPAREQEYAVIWAHHHVTLAALARPPLCAQFPSLAAEIFTCYLAHTRVSAEIWLNYDAVADWYYFDKRRLANCGQLNLTPRQRARVEALLSASPSSSSTSPQQLPPGLRHVELRINTPFHRLCTVAIDVVEPGRGIFGGALAVAGPQQNLPGLPEHVMGLVKEAITGICEAGLQDANLGITWAELDAWAKLFVRTAPAEGLMVAEGRDWVWDSK